MTVACFLILDYLITYNNIHLIKYDPIRIYGDPAYPFLREIYDTKQQAVMMKLV